MQAMPMVGLGRDAGDIPATNRPRETNTVAHLPLGSKPDPKAVTETTCQVNRGAVA